MTQEQVRKEISDVKDILERYHEQLQDQVKACARTVEAIRLLEERLKELHVQEYKEGAL